MQTERLVSIVYPVYNGEKYIKRSFLSCINQTCDESAYEIIVVDDGSQDHSIDLIMDEIRSHPNVRLHRQSNHGLSHARNTGISLASGKYIWCVDSDDVIYENAISTIVSAVGEKDYDIVAIGADAEHVGWLDDRTPYLKKIKSNECSGNTLLSIKLLRGCAQFYLFHKEFLEKNRLRFYNGIYYEDTEFTPRAISKSKSIYLIKESLYKTVFTPNSISRSKPTEKRCLDLLFVAKRLIRFGRTCSDRRKRLSIYRIACSPLNLFLAYSTVIRTDKTIKASYESRKYYHYLVFSRKPAVVLEGLLSFLPTKVFLAVYRFSRHLFERCGAKKKIG